MRLNATPTPLTTPGYQMPGEMPQSSYDIPQSPSDPTLPDIKPEDMQYFGSLLKNDSEEVRGSPLRLCHRFPCYTRFPCEIALSLYAFSL